MKGTTKYVVLGLLNNEDLTGYEMKKIIDSRMALFWNESYGQIYPALKQLEEEHMVRAVSKENDKKSNCKGKCTYTITTEGRKMFEDWLVLECQKDSVRIELLLKIFFATQDNIDKVQVQLENLYKKSKETLDMYTVFEEQLKQVPITQHNHKYMLQFIQLGHQLQKVCAEWSKDYLDKIERGEL